MIRLKTAAGRRGLIRLGMVVGACLGWLWAATTLADGLVRDGVGPISTGRGGTNIGHSDNAAVIMDNPAGLVNFDDKHFAEFGIDTVITVLHYNDPDPNSVASSTQPFPVPELGYVRRSEDGQFAWGIGLFAPAGFCGSYQMNAPIFGPGTHQYRSKGMYGKILPALSFKVTDELSIGATLGLGVTRIELESPMFLQTGPLAGVPALFDMTTTGAALIWSLGAQYQLSEQTTIGLVYQSNASFDTKGDLDASVVGLAPVAIPSHFNTHLSITWPQSVGAGIRHRFNQKHRVSADVIWYDWHEAFDDLSLKLSGASNPLFSMMLGPVIRDHLALNWSDTVSLRLGYELFATDSDTWRLGYVYHPSPAPASTLNPLIDGVLEHAFAIGYSKRWETWSLNLAYQYSFGPRRYVGDSILVGGDFSNSSFKAEAHWIGVSLSRSF